MNTKEVIARDMPVIIDNQLLSSNAPLKKSNNPENGEFVGVKQQAFHLDGTPCLYIASLGLGDEASYYQFISKDEVIIIVMRSALTSCHTVLWEPLQPSHGPAMRRAEILRHVLPWFEKRASHPEDSAAEWIFKPGRATPDVDVPALKRCQAVIRLAFGVESPYIDPETGEHLLTYPKEVRLRVPEEACAAFKDTPIHHGCISNRCESGGRIVAFNHLEYKPLSRFWRKEVEGVGCVSCQSVDENDTVLCCMNADEGFHYMILKSTVVSENGQLQLGEVSIVGDGIYANDVTKHLPFSRKYPKSMVAHWLTQHGMNAYEFDDVKGGLNWDMVNHCQLRDKGLSK